MKRPGQALGDVVFEAVHPLHCGPIDVKGGVVPPLLLPKVHYQLFSLADGSGPLLPSGRPFYCYL